MTGARKRAVGVGSGIPARRRLGRLLGLLWLLVSSGVAAQPLDPIRVYYPAASCRSGILEIEVWNRDRSGWEPHPEHPRIVGDTCHVEDAGVLLNEVRIRCIDATSGPPARWRVGVDVWSPVWMETCARPLLLRESAPKLSLRIDAPRAGASISNARRATPVRGAVLLGGGQLAAHDVMLLLDLSPAIAADRRSFVSELARRLAQRPDAIRLGVVTYSSEAMADTSDRDAPERQWVGAEAALAVPLRSDLAGVAAEVAALRSPRATGSEAFPEALSLALDALAAAAPAERRAAQARVIVLADGRSALPFGGGAARDPVFRRRLLEAVTHAAEVPTAIHLLSLAGGSAKPPLARTLARRAGARFDAVPDAERALALLPQLAPPQLDSLSIANLSLGQGAAGLQFERDGSFSAMLPLAEGANRFSVVAQLDDGRVVRVERDISFDSGPVRELWLREERLRRGKQVEVDAEQP